MTETLMDFMHLVTESGAVPVLPAQAASSPLDELRTRFQAALDHLNADAARLSAGGRLIAAPLCPAACEAGPLANTLQAIGTHPYASWNMMLYADTAETAAALDTIAFHPAYATDTNQSMVDYIQRIDRTCEKALGRLLHDCGQIEKILFGQQVSWANYIEMSVPDLPPNDLIKPTMSAGTQASNDSSCAAVG